MNNIHRFVHAVAALVAVTLLLAVSADAQQIMSSGKKGAWSGDSTWVGGVKPGPNNQVVIAAGDSVSADTSFSVASLTIGEASGAAARLRLIGTKPINMTITGDFTINAGSALAISSSTWDNPDVAGTINEIVDTLTLSGNFTSTGVFDLSTGSAASSKHNVRVIFVGSTNSTVTCGNYVATGTNEWAGITFRKTGGARVILNSNVFTYGGSSNSAAHINPYVYFESGLVEAVNGALITVWTDGTTYRGYGPESYVIGAVGRGINNGGGASTKEYPIGDENGYRPVTLRFNAPSNSTGHYVKVRTVTGDAAGVTSTLGAGIDKVSTVRYYEVTLGQATGTSVTQNMTMTHYQLKYKGTDGVANGNENLRVAINDTTTPRSWKNAGPLAVPHMTRLDTAAYIVSDSTVMRINMFGAAAYIALARATGTTENTLTGPGTSVETASETPAEFTLGQNYPNPFNPTTQFTFGLPAAGRVTLAVYNLLGQRMAILVNGPMSAGTHTATWNGRDDAGQVLPSGVYLYRLESGSAVQVKKMMLMK